MVDGIQIPDKMINIREALTMLCFCCKGRRKRLEMTPRERVRQQHFKDIEMARSFISNEWPTSQFKSEPVDTASMICWSVSTTELSTVLLISKGLKTAFTRNTYSADEQKPWLIYLTAPENELLSRHISDVWREKTISRSGDPDLVDQIAEHVVYKYDRENNEWLLLPIAADESNVIRFQTDDFVMWSHPPRDAPLTRVLEDMEDPEGQNFNQVKGDMGRFFNELISIRRNIKIPDAKRSIREADQLKKIGVKFSKLYKFYETMQTDNHVPNSYMWPTLQLGVKNGERKLQRYGETFAGVYEKYENEVHHVFPALNVKARALPSKEEVFQALLPEGLNLTLHDIEMADQNQR